MTERLARASSRRPWLVVGLWLVVLAGASWTVATLLEFEGEAEITRRRSRSGPTGSSTRAFRAGATRAGDHGGRRRAGRRRRGRGGCARARVDALADECVRPGRRGSSPTPRTGLVSSDGDSTVLLVALGRDGEGDVDGCGRRGPAPRREPGYRRP